jgi:hypothetical protein
VPREGRSGGSSGCDLNTRSAGARFVNTLLTVHLRRFRCPVSTWSMLSIFFMRRRRRGRHCDRLRRSRPATQRTLTLVFSRNRKDRTSPSSAPTGNIASDIHHATQRTLIVDSHELAYASLSRYAGSFELVYVVCDQQLVLAIEKRFEARKCIRFFAQQLLGSALGNGRIHDLFLRSAKIFVHSHQLVSDALRRDFIPTFFDHQPQHPQQPLARSCSGHEHGPAHPLR